MNRQDAESVTQRVVSGRGRSSRTRRSVVTIDRTARLLITLGGLGTIGAVFLVCVFLVWMVVPLFRSNSLSMRSAQSAPAELALATPIHLATDEYLNLFCVVTDDGRFHALRASTGEILNTEAPFKDDRLTAWSFGLRNGDLALVRNGDSVHVGNMLFESQFLDPSQLPDAITSLAKDETAVFNDGIVQRTAEGQYRWQKLRTVLEDALPLTPGAKIKLIDQSISSKGRIVAILREDGELQLARVTKRKNLLTGKLTTRLKKGRLRVKLPEERLPERLMLSGLGDALFLVWRDGRTYRFDTRDISRPAFMEEVDLLPEREASVTSLAFLVGKTTLVVGDSLGRVNVWFRTKPATATTADGSILVQAHSLPGGSSAVTQLAPSSRSRMLAAAFADGTLRHYHVTSAQLLATSQDYSTERDLGSLLMAPKDDAIIGLAGATTLTWAIDAPHPEITWSAIMRPVWYEGAAEPQHVWQSSSGTDDFEEKFGLMPLIFGTLKATFYSMLFGGPLALLAAIYTSEFLDPKIKAKVKPTIEIMASLPSVVLGFLAALFFAPLVENVVPEFLTAFVTIPWAYLCGAYLWQLWPIASVNAAARIKMVAMFAALGAGIYLAYIMGPVTEAWLFSGDIKSWLAGQVGDGAGAWMFLVLPLAAVAAIWLSSRHVTPALRRRTGHLPGPLFAAIDLAKFLMNCLATLLVAYVLSWLLSEWFWDPRGTFVDTYEQRNALVVGFIMGFAIIPIIYTIADDALSAVPESLRAASLGAGATPWQTAVRIVIPTAMSGLFSALMVGLGRAVGETMIVLMAAGNTPVMEWNLFNGFRTLSANIAVELPEAVKDSTHYRMLFLAALSLFAMTFVVNTVAEIVRLQFRKRAFQL